MVIPNILLFHFSIYFTILAIVFALKGITLIHAGFTKGTPKYWETPRAIILPIASVLSLIQ